MRPIKLRPLLKRTNTFCPSIIRFERPLERSNRPDGGALVYRVVHRSKIWKAGEHPHLDQEVLEENPSLSL